jgi:hypothetical protein
MNAWLKRLALSFIVTLGFAAYKLPAQAPLVPPSQPFDSNPSAPLMAIIARPQEPPVRAATPFLNSQGFCCDSNLTWYGCGGLKSQADFMFGSCRTFFSEICVPKAPHSSMHSQYGQ